MIHFFTWRVVKARSGGICERCGKNPAAHMHHLTYKNHGYESPLDIEHICVECHIEAHPHRKEALKQFEAERADPRNAALADWDKYDVIERGPRKALNDFYPIKTDPLIKHKKGPKDRR